MKNLNYSVSQLLLILLITFFIIGCAGEPLKIDLPANHPTNPEAQETVFTPPPNPFQKDVAAMQSESTPDSMVKHKTHEERGKQHMDHNLGTDETHRSDSESTNKSGHGEGDNQHKGHSQ